MTFKELQHPNQEAIDKFFKDEVKRNEKAIKVSKRTTKGSAGRVTSNTK